MHRTVFKRLRLPRLFYVEKRSVFRILRPVDPVIDEPLSLFGIQKIQQFDYTVGPLAICGNHREQFPRRPIRKLRHLSAPVRKDNRYVSGILTFRIIAVDIHFPVSEIARRSNHFSDIHDRFTRLNILIDLRLRGAETAFRKQVRTVKFVQPLHHFHEIFARLRIYIVSFRIFFRTGEIFHQYLNPSASILFAGIKRGNQYGMVCVG